MNKEEKNMERYTLREGGRVLCPTERLEAALERLAAARRGLYASCACHRIPESLLEKAVEDIENIWRGENI